MKIYQLCITLTQTGATLSYHGSKRAANIEAAKARREFAMPAPNTNDVYDRHRISPITFEPTKAGILRMLNAHTPSTDNG